VLYLAAKLERIDVAIKATLSSDMWLEWSPRPVEATTAGQLALCQFDRSGGAR
jgi:hypothetical protein